MLPKRYVGLVDCQEGPGSRNAHGAHPVCPSLFYLPYDPAPCAESYGSAEAFGRISKGGKMQGATERRSEIMKILCRRRSETVGNLAFEFGVSERTIRRDIEVLSLSEPIYTQSGRYGGGVYVEEGYSMYRMYMTETELRVLNKIDGLASAYGLDDGEMQVLHSIISAYTKPGKRNGAPN